MYFVIESNLKKAVEYYGADPKRCFFIESGVNSSLFSRTSAEEIEKSRLDLCLDPEDKVILNHGVMSERKNGKIDQETERDFGEFLGFCFFLIIFHYYNFKCFSP